MTTTLTLLAPEDIAAIRRMIEEDWKRIMLAGDWDAMAALLTGDVVFMPPEQPLVQGRQAVRTWMDSFPIVKAFNGSLEAVDGRGDFAWARGVFEMTLEPAPGSSVTLKGKWTGTVRKQPDGRWLLASDIWNTDHSMA